MKSLKSIDEFPVFKRQDSVGWTNLSHPRPRVGKTNKDHKRKGLGKFAK